jgi:hypothetical protein
MRYILHYFAVGLDGRGTEVSLPIRGDSKKTVLTKLRDAAEQAACLGEMQFDAFGAKHFTHSFIQSVSVARLTYLRELASSKGKSPPQSFIVQGCNFIHIPAKLLTVDEWFDTHADHSCLAPA